MKIIGVILTLISVLLIVIGGLLSYDSISNNYALGTTLFYFAPVILGVILLINSIFLIKNRYLTIAGWVISIFGSLLILLGLFFLFGAQDFSPIVVFITFVSLIVGILLIIFGVIIIRKSSLPTQQQPSPLIKE